VRFPGDKPCSALSCVGEIVSVRRPYPLVVSDISLSLIRGQRLASFPPGMIDSTVLFNPEPIH
jgi:hypothetical protein